jgi:hypothetical protein
MTGVMSASLPWPGHGPALLAPKQCRWGRGPSDNWQEPAPVAYLRQMKAFEFCIPTAGIKVPVGPEWLHEIKYDGFRLRVERETRKKPMPTFKPLTAAILAAMVVTPSLAQAVIQEPGYCALFYPTANCRRRDGGGWGAGQWSNSGTSLAMAPKRPPRRTSSPSSER